MIGGNFYRNDLRQLRPRRNFVKKFYRKNPRRNAHFTYIVIFNRNYDLRVDLRPS